MAPAPTNRPASARARSLLVATLLAAASLAGCSSSGSDDAEAADDVTTTTAAATTTTEADPGGSSSAGSSDDANAWTADAQEHRGSDGEQFEQDCPAGGEPDTIWGVELYTDDSSICTAAVHVGLIDLDDGGTVTYEIAAGEDRYDSGVANGITSQGYGGWGGSFLFPDAPPGSGEFEPGQESWSATVQGLRLEEGASYEHRCSPDGELRSVWGTDVYTADSSICTAAVHAGLIAVDEGGAVAVEVVAGQDSYEGTEANGVVSSAYGSFGLSYRFADEQPEG